MQGHGQQGYGPPQGYPQGPPQQQPPKQGMATWVKVLLVLGLLGMCGVAGCIVCIGAAGKAGVDAINEAAATASAKEAAAKKDSVKVDIKKLVADYKENEVRADEAYKGKYITTGGIVRDISKDFTDSMIVMVEPNGAQPFEFPVVACYPPDSEKATAAALNKGQVVAINGRVDGKIVTNIVVRECTLKVSAASPAPPATAPAPAKKGGGK